MEENYLDRYYMIFETWEASKVDFSQILETSIETLRKSLNNFKTFCKWDGFTIPSSVDSLLTKEGPYTYDQMISILNSPEWEGFANEENPVV